jgi:hypothetical protein
MVKATISPSDDDRIATFLDSFRNLKEKFSTSLMIQAVVDENNRGETINRVVEGIGLPTVFVFLHRNSLSILALADALTKAKDSDEKGENFDSQFYFVN